MDVEGEELTDFTLLRVGGYEDSSRVSMEEMDFNCLTDGQTKVKMNQSIIKLQAERSSIFKH